MKFSHICPHEDGGDRGGVWGRTFCPPLFAVPGPPHSPAPGLAGDSWANTHRLTGYSCRTPGAAGPERGQQGTDRSCAQATGRIGGTPRSTGLDHEVRSVSWPVHRPSRLRILRRSSRTSSLDSSCSGTSMSATTRAGRSDRTTTRLDRRRASSTSWVTRTAVKRWDSHSLRISSWSWRRVRASSLPRAHP